MIMRAEPRWPASCRHKPQCTARAAVTVLLVMLAALPGGLALEVAHSYTRTDGSGWKVCDLSANTIPPYAVASVTLASGVVPVLSAINIDDPSQGTGVHMIGSDGNIYKCTAGGVVVDYTAPSEGKKAKKMCVVTPHNWNYDLNVMTLLNDGTIYSNYDPTQVVVFKDSGGNVLDMTADPIVEIRCDPYVGSCSTGLCRMARTDAGRLFTMTNGQGLVAVLDPYFDLSSNDKRLSSVYGVAANNNGGIVGRTKGDRYVTRATNDNINTGLCYRQAGGSTDTGGTWVENNLNTLDFATHGHVVQIQRGQYSNGKQQNVFYLTASGKMFYCGYCSGCSTQYVESPVAVDTAFPTNYPSGYVVTNMFHIWIGNGGQLSTMVQGTNGAAYSLQYDSITPSWSEVTFFQSKFIASYFNHNDVWSIALYSGCVPGQQVGDAATAGSCTDCQAGQYSTTGTVCVACPTGTSTMGLTKQTSCSTCAAGTYAASTGTASCTLADLGTIAPTIGMTAPLPCAAGYFMDVTGQTVCKECAAGTASSTTGASSCSKCEQNYYQNLANQQTCKACPLESTTEGTGKDSKESCACDAGTYGDVWENRACATCPAQTVCARASKYPYSNPGFWLETSDASTVIACSPQNSCPGGNKCGDEYTGYGCIECSEGYYREGTDCAKCRAFQIPEWGAYTLIGSVFVFLVTSGLCGLCVFSLGYNSKWFRKQKKRLSYLSNAVSNLSRYGGRYVKSIQYLGFAFSLALPKAPTIAAWSSLFTLSVSSIFQFECYSTARAGGVLSPSNRLMTTLILTTAAGLVLVLALPMGLIVYWSTQLGCFSGGQCAKCSSRLNSVAVTMIRATCNVLNLFFPTLMALAITPFSCYEQKRGVYRMVTNPSVQCWVDDGSGWMTLSIFSGFTLCCMISYILFVVWVTTIGRRSDRMREIFAKNYFDAYRDGCKWWEIVVLLQKFVVSASFVMTNLSRADHAYFVLMYSIILLAVHIKFLPYKTLENNNLDTVLYLCLSTVLICIVVISAATSEGTQTVITEGLFTGLLFASLVLVLASPMWYILESAGAFRCIRRLLVFGPHQGGKSARSMEVSSCCSDDGPSKEATPFPTGHMGHSGDETSSDESKPTASDAMQPLSSGMRLAPEGSLAKSAAKKTEGVISTNPTLLVSSTPGGQPKIASSGSGSIRTPPSIMKAAAPLSPQLQTVTVGNASGAKPAAIVETPPPSKQGVLNKPPPPPTMAPPKPKLLPPPTIAAPKFPPKMPGAAGEPGSR